MSEFVLDASVALSWFVDHPTDPYAVRVRDHLRRRHRAIVPALWELEFANGLLVAERRKIADAVVADESIAEIERLKPEGIEVDSGLPRTLDVMACARTFHLTAYDAAYLELARRRNLPLATLDKALRASAAKAGVKLL